MTRVLVTGLSGVGKSTVVRELAARGHRAVDLDDPEWSEWVPAAEPDPVRVRDGVPQDWVWREDRVRRLLAGATEPLFVSGTSPNQGRLYPLLDHVVLLSAPAGVMAGRLATRTTNAYGSRPDELVRALRLIETVEPLLRRGATLEIDASLPLDRVVEAILDHAAVSPRRGGPPAPAARG